jgi:hypothetical protein
MEQCCEDEATMQLTLLPKIRSAIRPGRSWLIVQDCPGYPLLQLKIKADSIEPLKFGPKTFSKMMGYVGGV